MHFAALMVSLNFVKAVANGLIIKETHQLTVEAGDSLTWVNGSRTEGSCCAAYSYCWCSHPKNTEGAVFLRLSGVSVLKVG